MQEIVSWERKFQVWQYSVSHSILLLRSVHPRDYGSRIDVLFPAVSLMHLKPSFAQLRIRIATEDEKDSILPAGAAGQGILYLLNEGEGYVCAAACEWHEDSGSHHDPSHFGPLRGTA